MTGSTRSDTGLVAVEWAPVRPDSGTVGQAKITSSMAGKWGSRR